MMFNTVWLINCQLPLHLEQIAPDAKASFHEDLIKQIKQLKTRIKKHHVNHQEIYNTAHVLDLSKSFNTFVSLARQILEGP